MKYITSIWTTIVLIACILFVRINDPEFLQQIRLTVFDQYINSLPEQESDQIILLNIGEESLGEFGQYPFPRQQYAQLISDLRNANAGMIGFTIMFPEADRFGGDEVFASWVKDNGIILSQDADNSGRSAKAPYVGTAVFGTGDPLNHVIRYKGLVTNIPEIEAGAWGHGLINAMPEVDGVVRRIPLISQINEELYPSFALETIRVLNEKISYTVKVNEVGLEEIILRPFRISTDVNGSIWINPRYHFQDIEYTSEPLPNLQGKTVLIGLTAKGLASQIPTPQGLKSAHQIQASVLQTIMNGDQISRPIWADILEIGLSLIGGLLILVAVYYLPIWSGGLTFFAVVGLSVYGALFSWSEFGYLLDLSYPLILYILIFSSASFNNFYKQFALRQQIKKQFGTYLSPDMVYMLQKDPSLLALGGERKEMSFLFMDICGFTPISEHYKNNDDPEGLVELVNEFLDAMTKIILNNGGTIDKYMGDCIMAFWNAPIPCENHAEMAVKSSIEIEAKTNELKEIYKARGLPDINVGTGINTGDCIVGNMGSESRFDYSVIGDAVNLAARLEATAARHEYIEYKTIISSFTRDQLPEQYKCEEIGNIKVKGKDELITIYSPKL
jgi:adenylate cyclase